MRRRHNFSRFLFVLVLSLSFAYAKGQELQAEVTIIHDKIRGESPSTFEKMQENISDFLNTTQWTNQNYKNNERIRCRFLIDLQKKNNAQIYDALLTVQSSRPVFNSSYSSILLNHKDKDILFYFDPFHPLIFDKNRVAGNNPEESNLTAILAYYAYLIIGLDQETFSADGGRTNLETAQKIVDEAPSGGGISGWKAFDGNNNRYWITENLLNVRYKLIHEVLYEYHRMGLDRMYDDPDEGRKTILSALNKLNTLFASTPNLVIMKVFFDAKYEELAGIFSDGSAQDKMTALQLLKKLDPSHITTYQKNQ